MSDPSKQIVIALGGNAISIPGEEGTIAQQFAHSAKTAERLCDVIERGYQPIITHGNGPQVGSILRRVEIASDELYTIPLEVCVADTQAGMGYMIAQCLTNAMAARGMDRSVTPIVTTVLVDADDPAFDNPTKPIGPRLSKQVADAHAANDGWNIKHVAGGQYRRVVPSPIPQEILELPAIQHLVGAGQIVITCGGGGIPVVRESDGALRGAAAVIDKDRTSGLLAAELSVQTLVILTAVDYAYLNFRKPNQMALERLSTREAQSHLAAGQFASGSMRPKIETSVAFVENSPHPDAVAIIAHAEKLTESLDGKCGTRIAKGA